MQSGKITAICSKDEKGIVVRSPLVGMVSDLPEAGSIIVPGGYIGNIRVLKTDYRLHLPADFCGAVSEKQQRRVRPVAYEELLLQLTQEMDYDFSNRAMVTHQDGSIGSGEYVIFAPTDGMFYRRPSPAAPTYVEEGDIIKHGQVLGLVEVMKTFNQILFSGENLPVQGKIIKICVADGVEVKNQQPLFIISGVDK